MIRLSAVRSWRRLLVAILALAAIDRAVPSVLARSERARYESEAIFRFPNSDLFALGPLTAYLREHPHGEHPRVAFVGDSVMWGYLLNPPDSIPARFALARPDVRAFNLAINQMSGGTAFLIVKATIDSLDGICVLEGGSSALPSLPSLIPVEPADIARFHLTAPDPIEARLQRLLEPWRLYSQAYRLQTALFGMSTREYVYTQKTEILRRALGRPSAVPDRPTALSPEELAEGTRELAVDIPRSVGTPNAASLRAASPVLFDLATVIKTRGKRGVVFALAHHRPVLSDSTRADFNNWFGPSVTFVKMTVPPRLIADRVHLTASGSAAVAALLARLLPVGWTAGRS